MSSEIRDEQGGKVILIRDITEEARVEKLKEDFITLVSHEFRTPVTAITGALEILTDEETGSLNDIQRDFLRVASSNTERIRQIMNDVIDVSTIQGGHLVLDLSPVLLSDVLNRANNGQIADLQERKKIIVETDLSDAPRVFGDPRRIVQIFANLISNAYKYTPEGGKVIITSKPEQENMVRISIADTGIGLSTIERTHLGEKFYRVDNSLIREISGTGLGLAITKALVELHNGRLEVSSTPGVGSIFSVLLPHKGTKLPAYNLSDYLAPHFDI
jgi:signal transduction histidine kinase